MGLIGSIRDWFYAPKLAALPPGTDAVPSYAGRFMPGTGEASADLIGRQKWITYANAQNKAVIATGLRYFSNLLEGTNWNVEPNEAGGAGATRGEEIIRQGLLEANLEGGKSWSTVVGKASGFVPFGFSLQATSVARREDGMVVYTAIEHRPQSSIESFNRLDERKSWESATQRSSTTGKAYDLPLRECFYCVDHTMSDAPDGIGLLRHVMELVRRLEHYEILEGIAYDSDMSGTPVAYAPLSEMRSAAQGDDAKKQLAVDAATANIRSTLEHRIKNPEKMLWSLLDSSLWQTADKQTLSSMRKWAIEVLKSSTNGLHDVHEVIKRLEFQIARVFGTEFTLVGAEGGSYSMHEDKTSMFGTLLHTALIKIAMFATTQLARRLIALNGLDPNTCTPRLFAEPISTEKIEIVAKALKDLNDAAVDDETRAVMHKRMGLPRPKPVKSGSVSKPIKKTDPKVGQVDQNNETPPAKETK